MIRLNQVRLRHTRHYLAVAENSLNDWSLIEIDLANIQDAWAWVSNHCDDVELVVTYGRLGWKLFEKTMGELSVALSSAVASQENATNDTNDVLLSALSEVLLSQRRIEADLLSQSYSTAYRSIVVKGDVINSVIVTGDNANLKEA